MPLSEKEDLRDLKLPQGTVLLVRAACSFHSHSSHLLRRGKGQQGRSQERLPGAGSRVGEDVPGLSANSRLRALRPAPCPLLLQSAVTSEKPFTVKNCDVCKDRQVGWAGGSILVWTPTMEQQRWPPWDNPGRLPLVFLAMVNVLVVGAE